MPLVVMGRALGGAGEHRQDRWGAVQRLDLATSHRPPSTTARSGGSRYRPTTSRTFSTNCGSLESFHFSCRCGLSPNACQMSCTAVCVSPTSGPSTASTSASRPRRALQRLDDHLIDLGVGDRPRPARPRLIHQPVQPIAREPVAPLADRRDRHAQIARDLAAARTLGRSEHDPRTQRQRLRGRPTPRPGLQLLTLTLGELNRNCDGRRHEKPHSHPTHELNLRSVQRDTSASPTHWTSPRMTWMMRPRPTSTL